MNDFHHHANLIDMLKWDLQEIQNSELVTSEHQAFVRLAANWLGYENLDEDKHFLDGAGDRGIDFWYATNSGFEIFQVKSHVTGSAGEIQITRFGSEGVQDLQRIVNFLTDESATASNKKLKMFRQDQWEHAIEQHKISTAEDQDEPFQVSLGLILFGEDLTDAAHNEYQSFVHKIEDPLTYKGSKIQFRSTLESVAEFGIGRGVDQVGVAL